MKKTEKDKIIKEVEREVFNHLQYTHYSGHRLLESVENTAMLVLREYGIENADITAVEEDGVVKVSGVEKALNEL